MSVHQNRKELFLKRLTLLLSKKSWFVIFFGVFVLLTSMVGHTKELQKIVEKVLPDIDPLSATPSTFDQRGLQGVWRDCSKEWNPFDELGWREAMEIALCHQPQIQQSWAEVKVQTSALGEARAAYVPSINFSNSWLRSHTSTPGPSGTTNNDQGQTRNLTVQYRLLDFGTRSNNNESAKQLLISALATHEETFLKVIANVSESYFAVLIAEAEEKTRLSAVKRAKETVSVTQRRLKRGVSSRNDFLQSESALGRDELALQKAKAQHRKARIKLYQALGLNHVLELKLRRDGGLLLPKQPLDLLPFLAKIQEEYPSIVAAQAKAASAEAKISSTIAEGLPTLDLVLNNSKGGQFANVLQQNRYDTTTVGATLNVPLFEGFGRVYKYQGSRAQLEKAEAQVRETEQQVMNELIQAHTNTEEAFYSLNNTKSLFDGAVKTLDSSKKRYQQGVADILELLTNQNDLTKAELEYIRGHFDWRSAQLRFLLLTRQIDLIDEEKP